LLEAHMPLVQSVVRRYRYDGLSRDDLVSEGQLGLLEAARRFNPERETRFSAYAVWWVRAMVRSYALRNRRIVPPPSTRAARRLLGELPAARRRLTQRWGREVLAREVAAELNVAPEEVLSLQAAMQGRDVPVAHDGGLADLATDDASPEQRVAEAEAQDLLKQRIDRALSTLPVREQEIVRRRLLGEGAVTLQALGTVFGLSRERVRQLEVHACAELRRALEEVA
jgi:RNA polymerase sigma-32 factor